MITKFCMPLFSRNWDDKFYTSDDFFIWKDYPSRCIEKIHVIVNIFDSYVCNGQLARLSN
jgi:hypothetical protein